MYSDLVLYKIAPNFGCFSLKRYDFSDSLDQKVSGLGFKFLKKTEEMPKKLLPCFDLDNSCINGSFSCNLAESAS